jgi:hypothetical protein
MLSWREQGHHYLCFTFLKAIKNLEVPRVEGRIILDWIFAT